MITVRGECVIEGKKENGLANMYRTYPLPTGLRCVEYRSVNSEADYINGQSFRVSEDNGRTWGEWQPLPADDYSERFGEDEYTHEYTDFVWNPVHGHYVGTYFTRYFLNGHEDAYKHFWQEGALTFFDHQYIAIRRPGETVDASLQLVQYEDGDDFDPANPRSERYLMRNRGFLNAPYVMACGDIVVPVSVPMTTACPMAGLDVNTVFPSCPQFSCAIIVARGKFDPAAGRYDFTFSNPVILSDLRSSRGICEPIVAELKSGRLMVILRGSNVIYPNWHTRIEKGAPGFKWYAWSDDGGKTFSTAEPWHFDDGEVIYSSSSISSFIRSSKNGKLYWVGNITDHTAYGNFPRWPLQIVEVDEQTGAAKKESYTVIDTRREGESEWMELSNFHLMEDRETRELELTVCKRAQFDNANTNWGPSWIYHINVGD